MWYRQSNRKNNRADIYAKCHAHIVLLINDAIGTNLIPIHGKSHKIRASGKTKHFE
jgi:hypothetical protein